jgi:hypothetical protein
MGSQGLATAHARRGGSAPPLSIVELAAIICTALKSAFGAASAAETRSVQWKGSPVRWKGPRVQRKVGFHSWDENQRINCSR